MQNQRGLTLASKMSAWKSLVTWTVEGKSFLSVFFVLEDPTVLNKTTSLINFL